SSSNWNHCINRFNSCLKRRIYRFSRNNTTCYTLYTAEFIRMNRPFSVNWLPKWINYTSNQCIANWNFYNTPCSLNDITFTNVSLITQQYGAHIIFFQIEHHTKYFTWEFQKFPLHCLF